MKTTSHGYLQTGQTTCHDGSGIAVPCTGSGQDGEFRRGIPWPEPRFEAAAKSSSTGSLGFLGHGTPPPANCP